MLAESSSRAQAGANRVHRGLAVRGRIGGVCGAGLRTVFVGTAWVGKPGAGRGGQPRVTLAAHPLGPT